MNVDELRQSRFLTKQDVEEPLRATIDRVKKQNVAPFGEEPKNKWCVFFDDGIKPLVLNSTNGELIAKVLGSRNTDDWAGKEIEIYFEPNVSFGGKLVGGIRVCPAKEEPIDF
jgi:hypothetical protein